jgi:NADP-dependent 3-hydroxy acid dehydrogenase YdfG
MSYSLDLSGRVALVTGASSGLGAQFARTLAGAGAAVVLASRRVEMLKTLRADIEAEGGDAHVVSLDVTSRKSIDNAIAATEKDVGPIDILVNNSGVSTTQRLVDVKEEDFDFVFDTNVRGAFFVAHEIGRAHV